MGKGGWGKYNAVRGAKHPTKIHIEEVQAPDAFRGPFEIKREDSTMGLEADLTPKTHQRAKTLTLIFKSSPKFLQRKLKLSLLW